MAEVTGRTAISIKELVDDTIVSGRVGNGKLILTTRGGTDMLAGDLFAGGATRWDRNTPYAPGQIVGYAGSIYQVLVSNTNKPPALFSSLWNFVHGVDANAWSEMDPYFEGDSLTMNWETFWKTGAPTCSLTNVAGEFESGRQALKIVLPVSSTQRIYQKNENIVRGGEIITVQVRAKLPAAAAGATLEVGLAQNDTQGTPEPLSDGATFAPAPPEGVQQLTSSWQTFTFTLTSINAKPRASVSVLVTNAAAASRTVLIDWVKVNRANATGLAAYPVGSTYSSVLSTNPAQLFGGGVWQRMAQGQSLVGVNENDPDFATPLLNGGAKTVTLAADQVPPHKHGLTSAGAAIYVGGGVYTKTVFIGTGFTSDRTFTATGGAANTTGSPIGNGGTVALLGQTDTASAAGTSSPHSVMHPFTTVYYWRRTA